MSRRRTPSDLWRKLVGRQQLRIRSASAPQAPKSTAPWQILIESGLFDAGFYSAQCGREFKSDQAAARHLIKFGTRRGRLPHPLINFSSMPSHVAASWGTGAVSSVIEYLRTSGLKMAWSPLFDPRVLLSSLSHSNLDEAERWEIVTAFLDDLKPETLLPTPTDSSQRQITWGPARAAMLSAGAELAEHTRLIKARLTSKWDEEAEALWLEQLGSSPLPETAGPAVSIIMPVWNRAFQVADAIRSVQAQDFHDWELVVADDGSTDGTLAVLREMASHDSRIRVLAEPHQGVCASRNAALTVARGRYVAFLDSDNHWRPHFLGTMLRGMQQSGLRAAYAGSRLVDRDGKTSYRAYRGGLDHLLVLNHIDLNVLVVERSIAVESGGFDASLRRWVDHDFAIRIARITEPQYLPFIGCDYDDNSEADNRITTSESDHWQYVVLGKALVDWESLRAQSDARVAGRVSVVIPTYQDASHHHGGPGRRDRGRRQWFGAADLPRPSFHVHRDRPGPAHQGPAKPQLRHRVEHRGARVDGRVHPFSQQRHRRSPRMAPASSRKTPRRRCRRRSAAPPVSRRHDPGGGHRVPRP